MAWIGIAQDLVADGLVATRDDEEAQAIAPRANATSSGSTPALPHETGSGTRADLRALPALIGAFLTVVVVGLLLLSHRPTKPVVERPIEPFATPLFAPGGSATAASDHDRAAAARPPTVPRGDARPARRTRRPVHAPEPGDVTVAAPPSTAGRSPESATPGATPTSADEPATAVAAPGAKAVPVPDLNQMRALERAF